MYNSIIWDLGGTLLNLNPYKLDKKERNKASLLIYSYYGIHPEIYKKAETIIKLINELDKNNENHYMKLPSGQLAPQIIYDWITGKVSSKEALYIINKKIDATYKYNMDIDIVKKEAALFFNPNFLISLMSINTSLIEIIKKYPNKTHYILSNWDKDSFILLMESEIGKELTKYIKSENMLLSYKVGLAKPDPKIYKEFIKRYSLIPQQCIMIDNQNENIIEADKIGIKGILYKDNPLYIKEKLCSLMN